MLPNASGTTMGAMESGKPQTYNFSYTFNGNYRLPANAGSPINHATEHSVEEFTDLDIVFFIQDQSSKVVHHGGHGTELTSASALDMQLSEVTSATTAQPGDNVMVSAVVQNNQSTAITSFDMHYSINGGTTVTETVSGVSLMQGDTLGVTSGTSWTATAGFSKVDVWIDNINGQGADDLTLNNRGFSYIDVQTSVGIQAPSFDKNMVTVFPNPVEGNLNISSSLAGEHNIEVFDILGKKWMTQNLVGEGVYSMDMSSLQEGIYFLRFSNGAESFTKRIVVK